MQVANQPIVKLNTNQFNKRKVSIKPKAHHHFIKLMGCQFILTAVHESPQKAWDALRAGVVEIERIEALISSWRSDSQTSAINKNAGIASVKVAPELFQLIKRSMVISKMTAGAFDISGSLSREYWQFDNEQHERLTEEKIHELRDRINYQHIILNDADGSVFLRKSGMKIGFGGIGKGYAAKRAQELMREMGINSGLVNASGDLMCWGAPPGKPHWNINIPNPDQLKDAIYQIAIPYGSMVTSGDYENFTVIDGERYSHIVDPRTGLPCKSLKSVTVVCPNPEFGDALATAISVLGPDAGIRLINRLNGVECLVVDQDNHTHLSSGFIWAGREPKSLTFEE